MTVLPVIRVMGGGAGAALDGINGVGGDAKGNVYFSDSVHGVVRKIDATGKISTIAGTGTKGYSGDGSPATSAQLGNPNGISVDAVGNIYIGDDYVNTVRKIDTMGKITTVAGGSVINGNSGNGGLATAAMFGRIVNVYTDQRSNLYVVDGANNTIRKVSAATGEIVGFLENPAFMDLTAVTQDTAGSLFFGDAGSREIWKATVNYTLPDSQETVQQFVVPAYTSNPSGVETSYITDDSFHRIATITPLPLGGGSMGAGGAPGAAPGGEVTSRVTVDTGVTTYAGLPLVARHYDITPSADPAGAQAMITLYFTGPDFLNYNKYVTANHLNLPALPYFPTDDISGLKIVQFHGVGTMPGTYTGATEVIMPVSAVVNVIENWWGGNLSGQRVQWIFCDERGFSAAADLNILYRDLGGRCSAGSGCGTELDDQQ